MKFDCFLAEIHSGVNGQYVSIDLCSVLAPIRQQIINKIDDWWSKYFMPRVIIQIYEWNKEQHTYWFYVRYAEWYQDIFTGTDQVRRGSREYEDAFLAV